VRASAAIRARARGFTLLEILVAVSILGVALVSLVGLHARNIRLLAESQQITLAASLASRLAAEAQSETFPTVGIQSGGFVALDEEPSEAMGERVGGALARGLSWRREVESTGLENLRRVRIAILDAPNADEGREILAFDFIVRQGGPP
jgi:prepilin-type N-terminal cleavage/methylation domain-containing protein